MVNCFESGLSHETGQGRVRDRHHHSPQGIGRWMGSYYLKLLKLNWSWCLIKDKPRLKWGTQKTSDHSNSSHAHLKVKFNIIINVHKNINLNSTNSQRQAVFTNFDIRWSFQTCQISADVTLYHNTNLWKELVASKKFLLASHVLQHHSHYCGVPLHGWAGPAMVCPSGAQEEWCKRCQN